MNGLIFLALDDFLESRLGEGAWTEAVALAGIKETEFAPDRFYPDQLASKLFTATASQLNLPLPEMLEQFGQHLAPGLVEMGRLMGVVKKSWKTIDILENLRTPILEAFANKEEGIHPPDIRTYRLKHSEVAVAYVSKRQLCHLLKGIIMGMGAFFEEPILFKERVCMLQGKAPLCRLSVFLDDPQMVRYVDIKREFEIVHSRIDELVFYNQFGGLPFSHPGLVLQFSDTEVIVQAPREQLITMEEEGRTFISVNHLPIGLQASVKEINLDQGFATLNNFILSHGTIGLRCYKRVTPNDKFPIEIEVEGKRFKGMVINISGGGVKIELSKQIPVDETLLFVQVSLTFSLPLKWVKKGDTIELGPQDLALDGNILDVYEEGDQRYLRIVFSTLSGHNLFLMDQLYQRYMEEVKPRIQKRLESLQ
ncbi:MAG: heme NO-binding domain-containing protein [Magnetococcales bacterium]|nr:heme NO-binding domain-containing protein [Magnetococcales bacterium]